MTYFLCVSSDINTLNVNLFNPYKKALILFSFMGEATEAPFHGLPGSFLDLNPGSLTSEIMALNLCPRCF